MTIERVHSSYILRLTQRLSRLTFELRDVRTGQSHHFESLKELSSYLESALEPPKATACASAQIQPG